MCMIHIIYCTYACMCVYVYMCRRCGLYACLVIIFAYATAYTQTLEGNTGG